MLRSDPSSRPSASRSKPGRGLRGANDDKTERLSRRALAKQRLKIFSGADGIDLLVPENVADFLRAEVSRPLRRRELLGAIFLDEAGDPVALSLPYRGYLGRKRIEPRTILMPAMTVGAASLIVFHNRPRGRRSAPRRDASIARLVREGCELLGLRLLDYLVLGEGGAWTSLRQERRARFHSLNDDPPTPGRDGRARVRPKYRNPEAPDQTWSGRGRMAKWLKEKLEADPEAKLEDFAIEE